MQMLLLSACIVTWGLGVFLMKVAGTGLGAYTSLVFSLPGYVAVMALVAGKAEYTLTRRHWIPVVVGALYTFGNLAYYKLCETQDISRLAPATALYVLVPVVLGWIVLREPVSLQRLLGLVFAGLALFLLMAPEKSVQP